VDLVGCDYQPACRVGLVHQQLASEYGTWYARSAEFLQTGVMDKLRWMRMIGDTTFAVGAILLGWFVFNLFIRRSGSERRLKSDAQTKSAPSRLGVASGD